MRRKIIAVLLSISLLAAIVNLNNYQTAQAAEEPSRPVNQVSMKNIDSYPQMPYPYNMKDWKQAALDFDSFVYDWDNSYKDFPTITWDNTYETYKLPAYYGDERIEEDGSQDALSHFGSVLGATLVGIDKSNQDGYNYVKLLDSFMKPQGILTSNVYMNLGAWETHWYTVMPNVFYYMLADLYPDANPDFDTNLLSIADKFYDMVVALGGVEADFNHQGFNFETMTPFDNLWKEPDAAAAAAVIQYWAYKKFNNPKYLQAAKWSLDFLERINYNPNYEMSLNEAAYVASRINMEEGTTYSIEKYLKWQTEIKSDSRIDFGTANYYWDDITVHGLASSPTNAGGYAFTMNSWYPVARYVPMVRYDPGFARAVGKWVLHIANNSWIFFADEWGPENQSYPQYANAPEKVIPYEGVRYKYGPISPYASGDPSVYRDLWNLGPDCTDLGIYGGGFVGFMGGIVSETNVPNILQLDTLKTDFYKDSAFPTYLYYNPYENEKSVEINLDSSSDLFDAVSGTYLSKNVAGTVSFSIPADSARLIVVTPADSTVTYEGRKTMINNVFVTYDPIRTKKIDDTSSRLSYNGTWYSRQNPSAFGGSDHFTNVAGSFVEFTFSGTSISWIGSKGANLGMADVYLNDELVASDVDCYSATGFDQYVLFNKDGLDNQEHTIKIVVKGSKNDASSDFHVIIDAFEYQASPDDADPADEVAKIDDTSDLISYGGPWYTRENPAAYGGSDHYSPHAGSFAEFTFKGTSIAWISSKGANLGKADVYINGVLVESGIDCYDAAGKNQEVLFSRTGLPDQENTIKIVVAGEKNPLSSDFHIIIDAFEYTPTKYANLVFTADASEISGWTAVDGMTATAELIDGRAVITETHPHGDWGAVKSPFFMLNFDNDPTIVIDVHSVEYYWTMQLHVEGQTWGFYIKPNSVMSGKTTIKVIEELKNYHPDFDATGIKNVRIYLMANGNEGTSVTVNSVSVFEHSFDAPIVTPEPTPEPTPEVTPEVTPDVTPEVTPEVTSEPTGGIVDDDMKDTPGDFNFISKMLILVLLSGIVLIATKKLNSYSK